MSILVLIESPGKQKKIQSFLGNDYEVLATCGHIRQLPKDDLGFDIDNNYEPTFENMPDKLDIIKKIKAKAKGVEKIIMSSDKDPEGESIAYHCCEILKLPPNKRLRATFTDITKKTVCTSVSNTIANNTLLDMNQVYSQFARMVLDKLIGYKVSPLLWKEYNNWHLSAGRVQSCVVKLIAEREAEIEKFSSEAYFQLSARFLLDKKELAAAPATHKYLQTVCETSIKEQAAVETLLDTLKNNSITPGAIEWHITSITKNATKRNPSPPYITSSLQQDASARLGMSPDACMKLAQKLYEAGLITYMRTDALFMSDDALKAIKILITNKWGERYHRQIQYKTKSASSQEAHECIRPTDFAKESITSVEGMTASHNRLYQLIWRRAVASQMAPADFEILTVKISNSKAASDVSSGTNELSTTDKSSKTSKASKASKASKTGKAGKATKETSGDELHSETPSTASAIQPRDFVFVGKHDKLIFDGYLACFNLHKKAKTANKVVMVDGVDSIDGVDNNNDTDEDSNEGDIDSTSGGEQNAFLEKVFTKLKEGDPAFALSIDAVQKYTKPAQSRYTEASIIKKLDDLGIGRPSTYASMIKKVQEEQRQYVERKSLPPRKVDAIRMGFQYPDVITSETSQVSVDGDKNKLFPTSLGIMINEYLEKNFAEIINYQFTAQVEALLDEIAAGSKVWHRVVDSVYIRLNPIIDALARATASRKENNKQLAGGSGSAGSAGIQPDTDNRKLLGMHPTTGLPVYAIRSRQGFLICESNPDKAKSRFASFTGRFESMTLADAIKLLVFPRLLGTYKDAEVILKKAKNVYIAWNGKNYSIENYLKYTKAGSAGVGAAGAAAAAAADLESIDPASTSLEEAISILQYYEGADARKQASAARDRVLNEDIVIKVGPYGAYIKYKGQDNIKLPKALKERWESLSLEEVIPIIDKHIANPGKATSGRGRGRGSSAFRGRGGRGRGGRGRGRGS
jgi:DNA topoisomerase I